MSIRKLYVLLLVLLFAGFGSRASAQTATGPEFRVNVETQSTQQFPQVAMNAGGDFVVAWVSADPPPSDSYSLYVRRFEADGTPATGEVRVSDQGRNRLEDAALAMMEDGSFLVVFPENRTLLARRYAPDGTPMGKEIVVTRNMYPHFRVASRGDGSFVVVWEAGRPVSIWFRAFRADGKPHGSEVAVNREGGSPEVAVGPDGEFVVIWLDYAPPVFPAEFSLLVRGQRFAADGRRQGRKFAVSPVGDRVPFFDIAKDAAGNFLVVWAENFDILGRGTFGRWYAQDGTPRPGYLRLLNYNFLPELAMDARGNFVLAWEDSVEFSDEVFGQRFTASGRPFRPVFRANTITSGRQNNPKVASDAAGNFVLVWQGPDEHGSVDVFARLYRRR